MASHEIMKSGGEAGGGAQTCMAQEYPYSVRTEAPTFRGYTQREKPPTYGDMNRENKEPVVCLPATLILVRVTKNWRARPVVLLSAPFTK